MSQKEGSRPLWEIGGPKIWDSDGSSSRKADVPLAGKLMRNLWILSRGVDMGLARDLLGRQTANLVDLSEKLVGPQLAGWGAG